MDIGTLHSIATVLVAVAFTSICLWAYSGKRKAQFDEAANLPFADDEHLTKKGSDHD
jgi:cytochrome c oxidase cbb3-type subunit IV